MYSTSRGPSAVSIRPAKMTPTYGVPAAAKWSTHRLHEPRHQLVGRIRHRRRRVRAHAAGVGAGVALADALVVLGQRQRPGDVAVAQRQQRALRAGHPLLEHERAVGGADRGLGLGVVDRHGHALAGLEPVELDDDRPAERPPPRQRGVDVAGRRTWRRPARGCRATSPARGPTPSTPRAGRGRPTGRSRGCPARRSASATPATSAASGPGITRSGVVVGEVVDVPEQRHVVAVAAAGPGDRLLPPAGADDGDLHRSPPGVCVPARQALD